jgi:hypothetical protein
MFGERGKVIKEGLEAIVNHKMALPVYASSASINKEVEKQSSLMMTQVMEKYHNSIAAMLQSVTNPMTPKPIIEYTMSAMTSMREFMVTVLRDFDQDETDRMLPAIPADADQPPKPPPTAPGPQGSPQAAPGQQAGPQAGMVPPPFMTPGGPGKVM